MTFFIMLHVCGVNGKDSTAEAESETTTTIILIRHAERDNFFILTTQGHVRAKALVDTDTVRDYINNNPLRQALMINQIRDSLRFVFGSV